jgi:WhiB family redox-sensing transcriptional regulator
MRASIEPLIDDWVTNGACVDHDEPDLWFDDVDAARRICLSCPVIDSCLSYALTAEASGEVLRGVWGGLSRIQRQRLLAAPARDTLTTMRRVRKPEQQQRFA